MPSFDIVSKVKKDEVQNAVDNANREVATRFDFRGSDAVFTLDRGSLTVKLEAAEEFQVSQMADILRQKMIKRGLKPGGADFGPVTRSGKRSLQAVTFKDGIDKDLAKAIVKLVKDSGIKADVRINDDTLRVSAKKKDALQAVMALVRGGGFERELQFENLRD